ncbi:hypothetical protein HUN01_18235 [Nostoc edaphicum CCNP1411]|uniref:Cyanovirin-N domain-containing protein n=1 Tax=Nostoc edaphicum CCNP1411 TaxID=1472755 RepID=A0A7D7QKU4_9NOSO|nr:hypothetical protein [Nostoc edaphicum]QMS89424.1 hypothetical protein HUN01_18235 [Nostoc edaphicum CCNP1411]
MKLSLQSFVFITSSLGLSTINFAFTLPVKAAIQCEAGNIIYYPNGSLLTCILEQNITVQVSSSLSGISNFPCRGKSYISFDEKGQFHTCELADDIQITTGNSFETCSAEYRIYVSTSDDGNKSIICRQY